MTAVESVPSFHPLGWAARPMAARLHSRLSFARRKGARPCGRFGRWSAFVRLAEAAQIPILGG